MWTTSYQQDTDVPDIGTVTAISDEGVTYSRRVNTDDGKDIGDFITEAKAVLAKHQDLTTNANAIVAKIQAVLNG